jgi:4-hydroxy-3-polyprenylbenzoate decarboxylase
VPAFYARPENLAQMVDHSLGRVLDLFGLDAGVATRWREPKPVPSPDTNTCGEGIYPRPAAQQSFSQQPHST